MSQATASTQTADRRAASHVAVAKLLKRQRRYAQSLAEWNSAIALKDDEIDWKAERADVLLAMGDVNNALADITECVIANTEKPSYALTLGRCLVKARRFDEAIVTLADLLRREPSDLQIYQSLAEAFEGAGQLDAALQVHEALLQDLNDDTFSHGERLRLLVLLGRFDEAIVAGEQAYQAMGQNAQGMRLYLTTLIAAGQNAKAKGLIEKSLAEKPGDAYLQHMVKALDGAEVDRVDPAAVSAYFDGIAATYNTLMPTHYNYRAPVLVASAVYEARPRLWPEHPNRQTASLILDLGSGGGLVGVMLYGVGFEMVGVDISKEMNRAAEQLQAYSALATDDVLKFFSQDRRLYEVITASQLLPYFGDLKPLLEAVYSHLLPTGVFSFTVETTAEAGAKGYKLEAAGRFRHSADYVRDTLKNIGFEILSSQEEVLQNDDHGKPVHGLVIVAEKPQKK